MSVFHNNALIGAGGGAAAAADFQIDRSLRFDDGDSSAYLNRTPSSTGNKFIWTLSFWIKLNKIDGNRMILTSYLDSSNDSMIKINGNGYLEIYNYRSGSYQTQYISNAQFRDPSSWHHFVISVNNSTSLNAWVNGEAITWSTSSGPNGVAWLFNGTGSHQIGRYNTTANSDFQLAEVNFVDGSALAETDFGGYDDNNVWQAQEYSGTYGTNGFRLTFADNSSNAALGNDSSGNSNTFTVNNLVVNVEGAETSAISSISGNTLTFTDSTDLDKFNAGDIIQEVSDGPRSGYTSQVPTNPENAVDGDINTHTIFSSNSGSSSDWYEWTLPYARSYTTLQIVMSGSAASGNDVYIGASNGTQSQATNQFEGSLSSTATAYTLTGMPNPVKSFSLFLAGGNYSPSFKLHGLIIDGSYVKTVTAASVSVANNQIVSEAGGDWATGRTAVKPAIEGDDMIDTPTNYTAASGNNGGNYAVMNPLTKFAADLANGNLEVTGNRASDWSLTIGTIGITSGKFYWEYTVDTVGSTQIGICQHPSNDKLGVDAKGYGYILGSGRIDHQNTDSAYGSSLAAGDVLGIAYDADGGNLYFYKNGTIQNSGTAAATGIASATWFPGISIYGNSSPGKGDFNFGQRPFAISSIPTGYKSLCTTNLPDPTIADGSTAFDIATYTGNATTNTAITGLNHSPDLLWIKSMSTTQWHFLADTVRGNTKNLASNSADAEEVRTNRLLSFDSNGFTIGNNNTVNENNSSFVAWAWDAGANSSKTFTVKVVSDSGNKYRFDDFGTSAVTLDLEEGSTYVFDQSDSSNSGHPLRFSTTSDGTHNSGSEYTTGVTSTGTPGSAGAKTTIVVAASAPTLYYYCSSHSGMGGQANTNSTAGASNFDGNLQATVKASQTAGFSIVSWTGNGSSSATVGHSLGVAPEMVIIKGRETTNGWSVYHKSLTSNYVVQLNSTSAQFANSATSGGGTGTPTSSVLTFDSGSTSVDNVNKNGNKFIAYCFAPVEGFSAFGSYEGNGSSDGPFIYTGFKPAFVLTKSSSNSSTDWMLFDHKRPEYNVTTGDLRPNLSNAETSTNFDILSNGFKLRNSTGSQNYSGRDYIYIAFAQNPFQANGGLAR